MSLATDERASSSSPRGLGTARTQLPEEVVLVHSDSRSLADIDRVAEEAKTRFGRLNASFLNAGVSRSVPASEVDEATYDELFDINTKGAYFTLQRLAPLMREGAGVVLATSVSNVSRASPV